jgi:hypothetical protein
MLLALLNNLLRKLKSEILFNGASSNFAKGEIISQGKGRKNEIELRIKNKESRIKN